MTLPEDRLNALAEACERASGPDRELDAAIAVEALGFFIWPPRYDGEPPAYGYIDKDGAEIRPGHGGKQLVRDFTSSIDAATRLVPEGWDHASGQKRDSGWAYVHNREMHFLGVGTRPNPKYRWHEVSCATPALALCATALRALASNSGGE